MQQNRLTASLENDWERDARDALLFPVDTSLIQSVGQEIRRGWGILGEAHRAPPEMSQIVAHGESEAQSS